jgi:hypothetical protein
VPNDPNIIAPVPTIYLNYGTMLVNYPIYKAAVPRDPIYRTAVPMMYAAACRYPIYVAAVSKLNLLLQ